MGARGLATFAIAAVFVAGCGGANFKNKPRPPVPLELTGVIQNDKVTVSPAKHLGAGPFVIILSNQTGASHTVTLEGGQVQDRVGSVAPSDTIRIQKTLDPGSYQVKAGTERAVAKEITPAVLDIGKERTESNSDTLLP